MRGLLLGIRLLLMRGYLAMLVLILLLLLRRVWLLLGRVWLLEGRLRRMRWLRRLRRTGVLSADRGLHVYRRLGSRRVMLLLLLMSEVQRRRRRHARTILREGAIWDRRCVSFGLSWLSIRRWRRHPWPRRHRRRAWIHRPRPTGCLLVTGLVPWQDFPRRLGRGRLLRRRRRHGRLP